MMCKKTAEYDFPNASCYGIIVIFDILRDSHLEPISAYGKISTFTAMGPFIFRFQWKRTLEKQTSLMKRPISLHTYPY